MKHILQEHKLIILSILLVVLFCVVTILPSDIGFEGGTWIVTQWGVTYVYGFIYRGFIGSILEVLDFDITPKILYTLYTLAYLIYGSIICGISIFMYNKYKNIYLLLFSTLVIVQPFITQWWYDEIMLFRFDLFIVAIYVIALLIATRKTNKKYILLIMLSGLAMIIHEAYAVLFFPTVFAMVLFNENNLKETNNFKKKSITLLLTPVIVLYLIVLMFGKADIVDTTLFATIKTNIFKENISLTHVKEMFYMTIPEKFEMVRYKFSYKNLLHILLTSLFMSPSLFIIAKLWKSFFLSLKSKKGKILLSVVIFMCFSPIVSFFVGIDTMRWYGYIILNNILSVFILVWSNNVFLEKTIEIVKNYWMVCILAVILSIVLGPTSYINGFKVVTRILGSIQ